MIGKRNLQTSGTYDLIPSGKYTLQNLGGVVEEGTYKGKPTTSIIFTFAILDDNRFDGSDGQEQSTRGRQLRFYCSDYLTPKSKLMTFVSAVDPKAMDMTDKQREDYNLDALEGMQVDALIGKNPSKTDPAKIYNNILSFEKNQKKLELLSADDMSVVRTNVVSSAPEVAPEEEQTVEEFTASLDRDAAAGAEKAADEMSDEELEAKLAERRKAKAEAK